MSETATSALRWLLPLCKMQNDLDIGNSIADVAELALQSLLGLHRAEAVALWLWATEPEIAIVTANWGNGQHDAHLAALTAALQRAGKSFGNDDPLPEVRLHNAFSAAPAAHPDQYSSTPIRLPRGAVGCVLVAGGPVPRTPEQRLGHDIILDGLATALRRERRYQDVSIQAANALAQAVDAKDHYTHYHSRNVSKMAEILARRLGLRARDVSRAKLAGLLHDVGKIGIPDAILHKPGPLDSLEMLQMRQHPVMGQRIIATLDNLSETAELVRAHHERWDGTGYPDGLKGEAIPLLARIISVVDAYDAMTTDRVYRPGMPIDAAAEELLRHRGTQFDPNVVDALVSYVRERVAEMRRANGRHDANQAA